MTDPEKPSSESAGPAAQKGASVAITADAELDTCGLTCPEPLMLLRHRMRELAPGNVLHVRATDPSTERDFLNYCRFVGHSLLASERSDDCYEFWLQHKG